MASADSPPISGIFKSISKLPKLSTFHVSEATAKCVASENIVIRVWNNFIVLSDLNTFSGYFVAYLEIYCVVCLHKL